MSTIAEDKAQRLRFEEAALSGLLANAWLAENNGLQLDAITRDARRFARAMMDQQSVAVHLTDLHARNVMLRNVL